MSEINLKPAPTVVFIDDSATMREVIKVAFRRENMQVVACHDASSAFAQIEQNAPDVVITDVIMPDKDGYEVCQFIKQHPRLGKTPVILMSGVVNKSVADKAFAVKADELVRKPFQPQDLITRVKHLLHPNGNGATGNGHAPAAMPAAVTPPPAAATLSSIFAASSTPPAAARPPAPAAPSAPARPSTPAAAPSTTPGIATSSDAARMRIDILRLEGLVKKLQLELEAEREYSRALEAHFKTLQGAS
jgi:CheY-like chemotaxis protein